MTVAERVKQLGALRDALLVSSSAIYFLGYFTWSIYAWRNHLGPVSALDAQYFAAGFPIVFGSLCTIGSVLALRQVVDGRWRKYVEKRPDKWCGRVRRVLLIIIGASVLATVFLMRGDMHPKPQRVAIIFALLLVAYALMPFVDAIRPKPNPDRLNRIAPAAVFTLAGFMGVTYFAWALYPSIPASLGGGRPRVVALDVQTSSVAPETLRMLLPPGAAISPGTVVRTREIELITAPGQNYLLGIPPLQEGAPPIRLQLERSSVVAVTWTK